jgi:alpha-D-ribose 1-methylphosphonate 5-triphosphate diphosphatase
MDIRIEGGRVLIGNALEPTTIHLASAPGVISAVGSDAPARRRIDADGLIVLPGIVDIHGDAFERQMMPRPGVGFDLDIALLDSDRQVLANGITTVFHGVTWSWEPGLRGPENARMMLEGIERLRPRLGADTRFHLRHETYNLDAEPEIMGWLAGRRIDLMAFNDHMLIADETSPRSKKLAQMVERSGVTRDEFLALVERVRRRANEVPASIERIAQVAVANGVPLLSHDDESPDRRRWFRSLGCRLAEFPTTVETAQEAAAQGDDIVLGAPMWCAAAAISAGSTPRTWRGAACARSWPRIITIRPPSWRRSVSWPRTSCRCMRRGRWSRRPPPRPPGSRIAAPSRAGSAPT